MQSTSITDPFQWYCAQAVLVVFFNSSASPSFVLPAQQTSRGSYKMSSQNYACIWPCEGKWPKPGSLNRHQKTCKHWLAHEEKMIDLRREAAMGYRPKKRVKLAHDTVIVPSAIQISLHFPTILFYTDG